MAPVTNTETVNVTTEWTTILTVEANPQGAEKQDGLMLLMQNDDAGGTVSFRVRAAASASGGTSRWLVVDDSFATRSSTDEPDAVITDLEFSKYQIQGQAASGTRQASAWHRFFSRESHAR